MWNARKFLVVPALMLAGCGSTPQPAKEGSSAPATATATNEDALLAEIRSKGAQAVMARLASGGADSPQWQDLIAGVSRGDKDKISAAVQLLQVSDAGYTESLLFGLSKAITTNPAPVLESLGPKLTAAQVCMVRQIEPTPEEEKAHIAAAKAALAKVDNPSLKDAKETCERALGR